MHPTIRPILLSLLCLAGGILCRAASDTTVRTVPADTTLREGAAPEKVYVFPIHGQIMPSAVRLTEKCLKEAEAWGACRVVIDLNTYGGVMDAADTIRTRILNYPLPVYVFINNQAASAGALIALAADSVYMREGASIGAATVVDGQGNAVPDKYQSFMRSMMRSTAEAHGKVAEIHGGDTVWRWRRDPHIAEAMVDPGIVVPGLDDSSKVVTLTTEEAIRWGFCEGKASSVREVLLRAGTDDPEIREYHPTGMDSLLDFLTNPAFQGVMIMLIVGGIYFELQTPGIGFPLAAAVCGALLYFAPLYAEGLAANWELLLFLAGIVLLALEIFVTPGFGVLGIAGIIALVLGLAFAAIDTDLLRYIPSGQLSAGYVVRPVAVTIVSATLSLVLSIWLGRRFLTGHSRLRERVVLTSSLGEAYVSRVTDRRLVGSRGVVTAVLKPTGRIRIGDRLYEAAAENGLFIPKDTEVEVVRDEGGILYCRTL